MPETPRRGLVVPSVLVALALGAAVSSAAVEEPRLDASVLGDPAVLASLDAVEQGFGAQLRDWIEIAETPGPSGAEAARAELVAAALRAIGLTPRSDEVGNVWARLEGHGSGPTVVLAAHMDAVPTASAPVVERGGGRLRGPGVLDNAGGVAALLATARAWRRGGVRGQGSLVLLATVGEETGLRGMRYWLEARSDPVDMLVAVDSTLGPVRYGALGLYWSRLVFSGPGAHTLASAGRPHPARAAAAALLGIYEIVPEEASPVTVLNVGQIAGGRAVNAVPKSVSFTVDLRSDRSDVLTRMDERVVDLSMRVARRHGVEFRREWIQRSEPGPPADRLGGGIGAHLVRTATDVVRILGIDTAGGPPAIPMGSSDANAGLAVGIPSVCVGYAYGGGHHTASEWADVESARLGTRQLVLLAAALVGVAGPAEDAGAADPPGGS